MHCAGDTVAPSFKPDAGSRNTQALSLRCACSKTLPPSHEDRGADTQAYVHRDIASPAICVPPRGSCHDTGEKGGREHPDALTTRPLTDVCRALLRWRRFPLVP